VNNKSLRLRQGKEKVPRIREEREGFIRRGGTKNEGILPERKKLKGKSMKEIALLWCSKRGIKKKNVIPRGADGGLRKEEISRRETKVLDKNSHHWRQTGKESDREEKKKIC